MNALEAALTDLRITGAVLLHERYSPGTSIAVPREQALRALLGHGPRVKVAPFHLVLNGEFTLAISGGKQSRLVRHDVAICLNGSAHQLRFGRAGSPTPIEDVLAGRLRNASPEPERDTELICGVFTMHMPPLNPLMAALPKVMLCHTDGEAASPLLAKAREMLALELRTASRASDQFTRARLLEIFFAETLRAHRAAAKSPPNWFKGVGDPKISMALTAFHAMPGAHWSVERLAAHAALSPSRFAARFRDTLGVTAMDYVAQWRINLACRKIESSDETLDAIAFDVGYGGGAALSKAFKDRLGCSPTQWRMRATENSSPCRD
ncbi:MAG: cupin domain-containing protein [Hyphomonadaceae bacterium]